MLALLELAGGCWAIAAVVLAYPIRCSRQEDRRRRGETGSAGLELAAILAAIVSVLVFVGYVGAATW